MSDLPPLPPGFRLDQPPPQAGLPPLPPGFRLDDQPPPAGEPQMEGFWRLPALAGSYLAKGALTGAGAVGDLQGWLDKQFVHGIYDPLHRAVGLGPASRAIEAVDRPSGFGATAPQGPPPLLSSESLLSGGRAVGAVDRPNLAPQTTGERYLAAGAEGVGGVLPYLPLGGVNPAAIGRSLFQGAAAGTAGEAGAQAFPEYADAARAVASLGGMALGGKAFDFGNKAVGAARGAASPLQEAYRNLGISPDLAGDVTQSPFWQQLQGYAGKSPLGAGIVGPARERAVGQWGQALDETATRYGAAQTPQQGGAALQNEASNWFTNFRAAQGAAEQAVAARVPVTASVDLQPVNRVLNDVTRRMPGLPNVAGIHENPTFQSLRTALAADAPTGVANWQDVRAWRSTIGEELERSLVSRDGNQEAWRRLYGALSKQLGDTAFAHGAHDEWKAANQITSQGHQFIERTLNNVVNSPNLAANTITPENAYSAAMTGANRGGTVLNDIRQQMPAAADELAAAKLHQSGRAAVQNAAGTEVSPRILVSNLSPNKLAPEARDALFGHDPNLAQRVEDLSRVGEAMRRSDQFTNWSGTGGYLAIANMLGGVGAAAHQGYKGYQEGGPAGAFWGAAGPLAAGFLPSYAAARAVTSPRLTGLLATPSGAPPRSLPWTALRSYPQTQGLLEDANSWIEMNYP
jgi:hypothetical protein